MDFNSILDELKQLGGGGGPSSAYRPNPDVIANNNLTSCNVASNNPGCYDATCERIVCPRIPRCCTTKWNPVCAVIAKKFCFPEIVPRPPDQSNPDQPGNCPAGFICTETQMASCTEVQESMTDLYKLGNVYGGIFCSPNSDTMTNCRNGFYCPTPSGRITCPAGYYCQYKTQNYTDVKCKNCPAGSPVSTRSMYGAIVTIFLGCIAAAGLILWMTKRYRRYLFQRLRTLKDQQEDKLFEVVHRKKRLELLERNRDKLQQISDLLAKVDPTAPPVFQVLDDGHLDFNEERMFDLIDANGDGDLSYEEINLVALFTPLQNKAFMYRMNELKGGRQSEDKETVSKRIFVRYFAQVLDEICGLDINSPDFEKRRKGGLARGVSQLSSGFYSMTEGLARRGKLPIFDLYSSPVANVLSDNQIRKLVKKFRRAQEKEAEEQERANASAEADVDQGSPTRSSSAGLRPSTTASKKNARKSVITEISKEDFLANYSKFMMEVLEEGDGGEGHDVEEEIEDFLTTRKSVGVDICFKNLSLAVKVGESSINVVDDLTGRIRARTFVALMGGSGAGKSSLLNALCGRAYYGETTGTIFINGKETPIDTIRDRVGFVPQDDIVYAELTCRENLIFSGKFRLPRGTPVSEIEDLADETLANLGLSRVANSRVGDVNRRGVSGGEKKRVNIGLELMALPDIVFMDEPTSGLDSNSALLVMASMRTLIETRGVTVVAVIHQPRKCIYDMFDTLILLGAGGKMVYHGPTEQAQDYFENLGFVIPPGENIADWFIDIGSGRVEPEEAEEVSKTADGRTSRVLLREKSIKKVSMTNQGQQLEDARARRQWLYEKWNKHFENLEGDVARLYVTPEETPLPETVHKSNFFGQLWVQLKRQFLVSYRNRYTKFFDICLVTAAVIVISLFEGVTQMTFNKDPAISFEMATRPNRQTLPKVLQELFKYAGEQQIMYPLQIGVIVAVMMGLQSTRITTSHRVEFFREASTTDINAYFVAINIVSTVEHAIEIFIAAFFADWLRNSISSWVAYYVNFLLLSWISVSWGIFFPQVVPAENVVVVVGFFFAFFSLLFSGPLDPITYKMIYSQRAAALISGWLSPCRFFIEAMAVAEYRCLPPQSGWTVSNDALLFPRNLTSFSSIPLAANDINVSIRSCMGWYWSAGPAMMVGLTIRIAACGAMHALNRNKQIKKPLWKEMRESRRVCLYVFSYLIFLVGMIWVTSWMIVRQIPPAPIIQQAEQFQAEFADFFL